MVEILGANIPTPKFSGIHISPLAWFLIFFIIIVIAAGGVGIWLINKYKFYNKKIIVFENISGRGYQPTYKDRARFVKLGDGGEEILYLLKKKVYRSAYGQKMGKNTYWYAIGQDGYWYNIVLGDVDAKMGMLDIEPIDRDMRYMHVAIRKNIDASYKKKQGIMEKYGPQIFMGIFLIIMIIGVGYLLNKIGVISSSVAGSVETAKTITQSNEKLLSAMNNICSNGGGIIPAG